MERLPMMNNDEDADLSSRMVKKSPIYWFDCVVEQRTRRSAGGDGKVPVCCAGNFAPPMAFAPAASED